MTNYHFERNRDDYSFFLFTFTFSKLYILRNINLIYVLVELQWPYSFCSNFNSLIVVSIFLTHRFRFSVFAVHRIKKESQLIKYTAPGNPF